MLKLKIRGIASAILAAALLAGCSGGGSKSVLPSTPSQSSSKTVSTTMSITIGGPGTQTASRAGKTIPVANSKSIVIRYVGDGSPGTNEPTNPFTFPSTAPAALIGGNAFWNITGCTQVGQTLVCNVPGVVLPVGNLQIYVLDYDGVGGTGNLIYGSVTPVQVTSTGAFAASFTGGPTTLTTLGGNVAATGATIALSGTIGPIVPNSSVQITTAPYNNFGPYSITATDANANPITGPIAITVTDADTSGNTCLVYVAKANVATYSPTTTSCTPTAGSASKINIADTGDNFYLQYNNAPLSQVTSFKVTAAPTTGSTPAAVSQTIGFTAQSFAFNQPNGVFPTMINIGNAVYVLQNNCCSLNNDLSALTFASGKLTAATTQPPNFGLVCSCVNNLAADGLNNVWFDDSNGGVSAIGVYAVGATTGTVNKGSAGETLDFQGSLSGGFLNGLAFFGGYIWAIDNSNDVIRIDPNQMTNGLIVTGQKLIIQVASAAPLNTLTGSFAGGLTAVAGVGLYAPMSDGSIVKLAVNTTGTATATTLVTTKTQSASATATPISGAFLASDGNIWSSGDNDSVGPWVHVAQTPGSETLVNATAGVNTFGGIAQGGLDNYLYTLSASSGFALSYVNVTGLTTGSIAEAVTNTCYDSASNRGQSVLAIGSYILSASQQWGNVCVSVP